MSSFNKETVLSDFNSQISNDRHFIKNSNIPHEHSNKFRIACLNIRSLYPKVAQVHHIIQHYKLDVLGLNETWLCNDVYDHELLLPGYDIIRKDRNRRGGGVCLFVNKNVRYSVIEDVTNDTVESLWIRITFSKEIFDLGVMYWPPSANISYFDSILDQMEKIQSFNNKTILMGDLNIDYKFDTDLTDNPVYNMEVMYDLKQLVESPTRTTINSSTLIDVILTNCPDEHVSTKVIDVSLSDHSMILTELKTFVKRKCLHNTVTFRDFKKFNPKMFLRDVQMRCDEKGFNSINGLNEKRQSFKKAFVSVCDVHAPMCTRRLKHRHNPWIDSNIVSMMYHRDYIKQKAVKLKDENLFNEYKRLRNDITCKIRQAKKSYFENELNVNAGNPGKIWKTISKITKGNTFDDNSCDISATDFNEYFANIGEKVSQMCDDNGQSMPWKGPVSDVLFKFVQVTCDNIEKRLCKLGMKSNNDVLGMDAKLLCISSSIIAPIITAFVNTSIETNTVPDDWKFARVSPVYKGKGSKTDKGNFRPISVISHVAKIFEKEIQVQLLSHLVDNAFISIDQSAYRPYHNTQTCLHRVIDDWLENNGDKMFTGVCLLDIKKCFDSINHSVLLKKLSCYGIRGDELEFFRSYLTDRIQIVSYKSTISDKKYVNTGVPQGSVLGPILFMIFVNDISQHIYLGTANLYADDCLVYCAGNNLNDVNQNLQKCIDDVATWYDGNKLVLNVDKCNTMLIGSRHKRAQLGINECLEINLNEVVVKQVNTADYLGVKIEQSLLWDSQIQKVCSQLSRKVGLLSRLRKTISKEILMKIYMTSIQPCIDYALTIWGNTTLKNLAKVQRIQNYAARIITGEFDYINVRGVDLVKKLGWMSVKQRFDYFCLLLMFKCIHGLAPDYLTCNIIMECEVSSRTTRSTNSSNLYVPYVDNEIVTKTLMYTGAKLWNSLPSHLKDLTSIDVFKCKLKRFILH